MKIHSLDNVDINVENGMKYALCDIKEGESIIKYGFPIGHAKCNIKKGELVHSHNLASSISGLGDWQYKPTNEVVTSKGEGKTFLGYLRADGSVGTRNEIWIVPTVGCANGVAKILADKTGVKALTHQFGCSQLGDDMTVTQKLLCGLIKNPNAAGILVLGLGCEENYIDALKAVLGEYDSDRVKFLNLQDSEDEIGDGLAIINELKERISTYERTPVPMSKLKIGIKCGGSDGYSGITANPLVGRVAEKFAENGATVYMTEVPEVFGAEEILLSRCNSVDTFERVKKLIQDFRAYFISHGEGISDNPSPGNVAGGITTLEEKSLGCVQKGGHIIVKGALDFGEIADDGGLYLVNGPGNDIVAVTNLAASGAQLIMFTTGRGTPLSGPVPTMKISTNNALYAKKADWIDFNAGQLLDGKTMDEVSEEMFAECIKCLEGKPTKAEERGLYDIAIFKNGVTL